MSGVGKRTYLRDVNSYLICPLCRGYLIDATTVLECLHSFCRTCILKHLNAKAHCPSCKHDLNKAKPNIKADKALQDIVYKLVPGLYHKEMRRRREFYKKHPEHADLATPEQRGEDVSGRLIFAPEDAVSLSLEYLPPGLDPMVAVGPNDDTNNSNTSNNQNGSNNTNSNSSNSSNNHSEHIRTNRRYLQCPALVTIAHLKKFLALKYSVDMTRYTIEICHRRRAPLPENWTLMDVAYIYAWKRNAPMRFFYRIAYEELEAPPYDRPSTPGLGASLPPVDVVITQDSAHSEDAENDTQPRPEVKRINNANEKSALDNQNSEVVSEKSRLSSNQVSTNKSTEMNPKEGQPSDGAVLSPSTTTVTVSTAPTNSTSTVSVTSTVASPTPISNAENKQSKTPIKILKNSEGRYEVLKSPPYKCNTKEETAVSTETKSSNPEFSVVSIGSGQNSNGVKITLKQCSPNNTCPNKPTVISDVLLRSSHMDEDIATSALMLQQFQREKERQQLEKQARQQVEKHERQQVEKQERLQFEKHEKQQAGKQEKQQVEKKEKHQTEKQEKQQVEKREKPLVEKQEKQQVEKREKPLVEKREKQPVEKQEKQIERQEKQRRRVTFVERMTPEKTTTGNALKSIQKKLGEQEKKQFLQGFQLTARESISEIALKSSSRSNERSVSNVSSSVQSRMNIMSKKEDNVTTETRSNVGNAKNKNNGGNISVNTNTSNRLTTVSAIGNARVNVNKQYNDVDTCTLNYSKNTNEAMNIIANSNSSTTVFQFNDLTVVPAGAVKRKCPPGVPLFDVKRKKQHQIPTQTVKKQPAASAPPIVQENAKSSRKMTTDQVTVRRSTNVIGEAGPSRIPTTPNSKSSSSSPALSNDTRNILDGCGLNIPASLSITLTAARSPSSNSLFPEPNGSKDGRKSTLGKVNPSITLNDRSVDPRVLKALKAGQIKMPGPPKPKQITTQQEREVNQQYHTSPGKRKRDQDSRDILDLSGGKKMDMHPLRIPQPVGSMSPKIKPAPTEISNNIKTQLVTRLDGQRFYQVAPGCNTPARIPECAIPSPRTPVYAHSGFLIGPLPNSKPSNLPNLSSVFPSLQSLFALSQQAPNVQRLQIDTRLRLPQGTEPSSEPIDPVKSSQQLSVQTKYSPVTESNNRCSPRSVTNNGNANNENNKPSTEVPRDSNLETNNDCKKEPDNLSRQTPHREAASPRVSSTASPSPPPGDTSTSTTNEATKNRDDTANRSSNGINNDLAASSLRKPSNASVEVSSSKSPASPDSSSVMIENRSGKECTTVEQELASSSQASDPSKLSEHSTKMDNNVTEDSTIDNDKKVCSKQTDAKQLTSEMFQKRLLAAFPSDEWANNPIAAEHLGNFLKSLNESIKSENKVENVGSEKVESQIARKDAPSLNNEASSKSRTDVAESS
ncbi:polycomb group protein Psc-like [Ceratina calcarata]|uniref:Polycomb group protein Psc-like n=1 Tax=Ceratina calcarata TaxID=156304 RepID=A0AAJ7JIH1_9HYME|nr:polycomb group protein Psc-like [Ceratina calcarata]XP_017893519.1 polycomb group protein Psc-like [Ceratina calcarata]